MTDDHVDKIQLDAGSFAARKKYVEALLSSNIFRVTGFLVNKCDTIIKLNYGTFENSIQLEGRHFKSMHELKRELLNENMHKVFPFRYVYEPYSDQQNIICLIYTINKKYRGNKLFNEEITANALSAGIKLLIKNANKIKSIKMYIGIDKHGDLAANELTTRRSPNGIKNKKIPLTKNSGSMHSNKSSLNQYSIIKYPLSSDMKSFDDTERFTSVLTCQGGLPSLGKRR